MFVTKKQSQLHIREVRPHCEDKTLAARQEISHFYWNVAAMPTTARHGPYQKHTNTLYKAV
jgi:hypothetical protein